MPAKLFDESQQSEHPQQRETIKKIDDLVMDAEAETQTEINQKVRSKNTRMLLLVLIGVGLIYALYSGVQNQTIPIPSFLMEKTQVAKTPPTPEPTPIPFPVTGPAPTTETTASSLNEPQGKNLSPLENEVISMIQKNLVNPKKTSSSLEPKLAKPFQQNPLGSESASPFNPKTATPRFTAMQNKFFIQVGAFSVKANADRVIKKLTSGGFSPLVQTRTIRPSMHVVFIGSFAHKQSPQNMITELRSKGLNPTLKKNDNGSYSVILGKEKSKEKAEAFKQKLTKKGIFTSMKQMKIDMQLFIVRVEGFENNTSALQGQKKLQTLGYKGTLIRKKS